MPFKFDKSLQYQFSLFYFDNGLEANELKQLPALISRQTPTTKSLGLKLVRRENAATVVLAGRQGASMPYFEWSAGSGIWKLTWTPIRLDLVFDALGYADIIAGYSDSPLEPPTLRNVVDRVSLNLAESLKTSSRPVNRMALIVTGVASEEFAPKPSDTVAAKFFSAETQRLIASGEIFDVNARMNTIAHIELPLSNKSMTSIRINQLETGASNWLLEDGKESVTLNWQLDVNTSPVEMEKGEYDKDAVSAFFEFAEKWISDRLLDLRRLNDQSQ
jgi:hypothetical protein